MRSEQQIAAEAQLEEAIRTAATAYGFGVDAEFIGDWVVVAELPDLNRGDSRYGVLWASGGSMPLHRRRGLLTVADDSIDSEG